MKRCNIKYNTQNDQIHPNASYIDTYVDIQYKNIILIIIKIILIIIIIKRFHGLVTLRPTRTPVGYLLFGRFIASIDLTVAWSTT